MPCIRQVLVVGLVLSAVMALVWCMSEVNIQELRAERQGNWWGIGGCGGGGGAAHVKLNVTRTK